MSKPSSTPVKLRSAGFVHAICIIAVLALALVASDASAACSSFQPPPELYVGDMASDAACTNNDIQSAIDSATCVYGTNIYITHEQNYASQHLNISDKNVTLIGRVGGDVCGPASQVICNPTCPPSPTSPRASISGHIGDAVLTISGASTVGLKYMDINGGTQASGFSGGGIAFVGSGSLTLDTSWVRGNHATSGGGIYFNGTGSAIANLNLLAYTQILVNTADSSGGGILVAGNAALNALQPAIQIQSNHATGGYGGGIDVVGPATANIGSPDSAAGDSVLDSNTAAYGGGISINASDSGGAFARLFTTDQSRPIGITNNIATHTGGGIYVKPRTHPIAMQDHAGVDAWDYRIEGNIAAEGAAIYADSDPSINQTLAGEVLLGNTLVADHEFPANLGAVVCSNSSLCNTLNNNQTTNPAEGSIILEQDHGYLIANRFSMRGNRAGHAIRIVGDGGRIQLFNCLIAGNTFGQELFYESGSEEVVDLINSCTFANNAINASHVIHAESKLSLTDSIIDEAGTLALDYSGDAANLSVNYVLSNDISTLPGNGTSVALGVPTFVDLVGGDYHLKATSRGLDFAPTSDAYYVHNGTDLDGKPRNFDLPAAGDVFGAQDLGVYELQNLFRECGASDSVFCDGFDHP
ncbi:MAG: hypothetical protein ABIW82_00330 [Dokdonella sp.]